MSKKAKVTVQELELALEEAQIEAEEAAKAQAEAVNRVFTNIAMAVEGKLTDRMGRRKVKESQWLESMRLYLGSLANNGVVQDDLFQLDSPAHSRPQHNIIANKCDIAVSQTVSYQFAAGDKNWSINPPQVVDLDPEDMQISQQMAGKPMDPSEIATYRARLMEQEIDYHLTESAYGPESRLSMYDWVILGTGVMKLPTSIGKLKKIYTKQRTSDGQVLRIPQYTAENVPCVYRANPWYQYPDDSVPDYRNCEDWVEIHPLSRTQLRKYTKHPGFFKDQIELVLQEEPRSYTNAPFNDPTYLTQGVNVLKGKYIVMEFRGPIKKRDLEILDKTASDNVSSDELYCEVWVVNGHVIRFEVEQTDDCYELPYAMAVWKEDPATPFGFGIPMMARDQQRVVNETYKMLLDNAGISAGPQVVVDTTLVAPAEGGLECTPWKVWYVKDTLGGDVKNAINFFIPTNAFEGLSQLMNLAKSFADEESSVPALMAGIGNPTGAGDSATQMAIFNQNAQSPLFYKSETWDDNMTRAIITGMYDWEMLYNPKDHIKGTYCIDVRTSTSLLRGSQEQQKLDRLSMEIAQGSPMAEFIKQDGLAMARLSGMRIPYAGIIKSPEEVEKERATREPPPPDPNLLKAQAAMEQVQVDKQRLEVELQKIQLEANQKHEEMMMKFEAQRRTDEVRMQESQAMVLSKQFEYQTALAQLASQDEMNRQKILAELQKSASEQQTQKFLAGMEIPLKVAAQEIQREEMEIKRKQGSGVTSVR